jgi:hypothetical protein
MDVLDEFQLMDRLATQLGIAGPESQEERNTSSLYQRAVLRAAIEQIKGAHGEGLDARMKAAGMIPKGQKVRTVFITGRRPLAAALLRWRNSASSC